MRALNFYFWFTLGYVATIFLFQTSSVASFDATDYVYDDDPSSPSTPASEDSSPNTGSLAVDVLTMIMSYLLNEFKVNATADQANIDRTNASASDSSTSELPPITVDFRLSTADYSSTVGYSSSTYLEVTTTSTSSSTQRGAFTTDSNITKTDNETGTLNMELSKKVNETGTLNTDLSKKVNETGAVNTEQSIPTIRENATEGNSTKRGDGNATALDDATVAVISAIYSDTTNSPETTSYTNSITEATTITGEEYRAANSSIIDATVTASNDSSSNGVGNTTIPVSTDAGDEGTYAPTWSNSSNVDWAVFPTPPAFDLTTDAVAISNHTDVEAVSYTSTTTTTTYTYNTTDIYSTNSTDTIAATGLNESIVPAMTTDAELTISTTIASSVPVELSTSACSHRSSDTLSSAENENMVSVVINAAHVSTFDHDSVLEQTVQVFRAVKNMTRISECGDMKLEIVDAPSVDGSGIRVHLIAVDPLGMLDAADVVELMKSQQAQLEAAIASVFSNHNPTQSNRTNGANQTTNIGAKQSVETQGAKDSHSPLDNPVIATSLIAVVVTVSVVAFLSLLILIMLQRHRRSRKGEWVVNTKDGKSNTSQQAYGWCFENDAFCTDEKKRPFPCAPALLDDRRRPVALPVDSPSFDVSCTGAFPVPPAPAHPTLRSFSRFSSSGQMNTVDPSTSPVHSAQSGWKINQTAEEMELTETSRGRKQRW